MKNKFGKISVSIILILAILLTVAVPAFALSEEKTDIFSTKYIAHRGYSGLYPQNTIPAFEKAVEAGYWGMECDIHTTKDGKWIVIHDSEISELTNGSGKIKEMTFDEIMQYKMDSGNGIENYGTLPIPTLEQYLDVCLTGDIVPVIEIKGWEKQYLPSLKSTLDEYKLAEKSVIISFDSEALTEYKKLDNNAKMFLLKGDPAIEDVNFCRENGFGINVNYGGFLKCYYSILYAKICDIPVAIYTVDNAFLAFLLRILGAEYITTNILN